MTILKLRAISRRLPCGFLVTDKASLIFLFIDHHLIWCWWKKIFIIYWNWRQLFEFSWGWSFFKNEIVNHRGPDICLYSPCLLTTFNCVNWLWVSVVITQCWFFLATAIFIVSSPSSIFILRNNFRISRKRLNVSHCLMHQNHLVFYNVSFSI